jgi:hypothetical protein
MQSSVLFETEIVDVLAECRFGFPKPLQEETELSLELVVGKNTKSVESELHTKRNDQRLIHITG